MHSKIDQNYQEQKVSVKHKTVAFLIVALLFVIVGIFVLIAFKSMDNTINRQPRKLSNFIGHSITLKFLNETGKTFALNKIIFPKDSYINYRYNKDTQKVYIESSVRPPIFNGVLSYIDLKEFLKTKIPECTIDRSIVDNIKEIFNQKAENGLLIILESNDNQSSIKFNIINAKDSYRMKILQTSDNYIELAPNNIHNDIDIFKCSFSKNSNFIKNLVNLTRLTRSASSEVE